MDSDKVYKLVQSSPEIVARHDREAWLGLFSGSAVVEDPVGAGPNRKGQGLRGGRDELARFYDVFIAPNDIKFTVYQDIIMENEMARDVSIRTTLPNGAISEVAALLLYRVVEEDGALKIESLRAHWDFIHNAMRILQGNGLKGLIASLQQFGNMIKIQGLPQVMTYCQIMYRGILGRGVKAVHAFARAVNEGDTGSFMALFDAKAIIEYPAGKKIKPSDFLSGEDKYMTIKVSEARSGGWYTACVFYINLGKTAKHGLAFFEFHPHTKKIVSARFFSESSTKK
jgi:hypothetical protein